MLVDSVPNQRQKLIPRLSTVAERPQHDRSLHHRILLFHTAHHHAHVLGLDDNRHTGGMGLGLYIGSGLGAGPRDGLVVGLNERFGWLLRRSRTVVELAALAAGAAFGGAVGIGTVLFAVGIGPLAQRALPWFRLPALDAKAGRRAAQM